MKRSLKVSAIAGYDLANIYDEIAKQNVGAAARLLDRIKAACLVLLDQPFVGPQFGENHPGLRFRVVGRYVVYYRVLDESVWIQRVIHGKRDASKLL